MISHGGISGVRVNIHNTLLWFTLAFTFSVMESNMPRPCKTIALAVGRGRPAAGKSCWPCKTVEAQPATDNTRFAEISMHDSVFVP